MDSNWFSEDLPKDFPSCPTSETSRLFDCTVHDHLAEPGMCGAECKCFKTCEEWFVKNVFVLFTVRQPIPSLVSIQSIVWHVHVWNEWMLHLSVVLSPRANAANTHTVQREWMRYNSLKNKWTLYQKKYGTFLLLCPGGDKSFSENIILNLASHFVVGICVWE